MIKRESASLVYTVTVSNYADTNYALVFGVSPVNCSQNVRQK